MSTRDRDYEKFRRLQDAYMERFGWWPMCGFPQFESGEELYAAVSKALETGVEIEPIYDPDCIY